MSSDEEDIAVRDDYPAAFREVEPPNLSDNDDNTSDEGDDDEECKELVEVEEEEEKEEVKEEEEEEEEKSLNFRKTVDPDRFSLNTDTLAALQSLEEAATNAYNNTDHSTIGNASLHRLQQQTAQCRAILSQSNGYLTSFTDQLSALAERLNATTELMTTRMMNEAQRTDESDSAQQAQAQAARDKSAEALGELQQMQKLTAEISQSSSDARTAAVLTKRETTRLDDAIYAEKNDNESSAVIATVRLPGAVQEGKQKINASSRFTDDTPLNLGEDDAGQENDRSEHGEADTGHQDGVNEDEHHVNRHSDEEGEKEEEEEEEEHAYKNGDREDLNDETLSDSGDVHGTGLENDVRFGDEMENVRSEDGIEKSNDIKEEEFITEHSTRENVSFENGDIDNNHPPTTNDEDTRVNGEGAPINSAVTAANGVVSDTIKRSESIAESKSEIIWSHFSYTVEEYQDGVGARVGCIVSAPEDSLDKMQLQCDLIDARDAAYEIGYYEERISNIIRIESKGDEIHFQVPVRVSIPYVPLKGSSGREREVVLKIKQIDDEWTEVEANDVSFSEHKDFRFLEIPLLSIGSVVILVIARLKIDRHHFKHRSWRLTSSVDPRISVSATKGCFVSAGDFLLQVLPIESSSLADLKTRYDGCEDLLALSPIVFLRADADQNSPYSLVLPWQQTSARKRPKSCMPASSDLARAASVRRPVSAWASGKVDDEDKEETSHLLIKQTVDGQWIYKAFDDVTQDRDNVFVPIEGDIEVVLLLRMQGAPSPANVVTVGAQLERFLADREVALLVAQREDDLAAIHIECCNAGRLVKLRDRLEKEGYNYGDLCAPTMYLREADEMRVNFRGNVNFEDEKPFRFVYNTRLRMTHRRAYIREMDRFAQHGLDFYRGHVQVHRLVSSNAHGAQKRELLCEIAVSFPKPPTEPTVITRAPVQIESHGPLTLAYFREVSGYLGDEWQLLADKLGIKRARLQSLIRANAKSGASDTQCRERTIEQMLIHWYKICPKSHDKVSDLYYALWAVGREDLSTELQAINYEFQYVLERKAEDERIGRAMKAVTHSSLALLQWKLLARELGVTERDITRIEKELGGNLQQQCLAALQKWREVQGDKAGCKQLRRALKRLKLKEAADQVSFVR